MKKFLIVVMVLALALTGCETTRKSYEDGEKTFFDKFVVLEERHEGSAWLYTMYDKETKVEYFYEISYQREAMCPIYNADGTVKVYEGGVEHENEK